MFGDFVICFCASPNSTPTQFEYLCCSQYSNWPIFLLWAQPLILKPLAVAIQCLQMRSSAKRSCIQFLLVLKNADLQVFSYFVPLFGNLILGCADLLIVLPEIHWFEDKRDISKNKTKSSGKDIQLAKNVPYKILRRSIFTSQIKISTWLKIRPTRF